MTQPSTMIATIGCVLLLSGCSLMQGAGSSPSSVGKVDKAFWEQTNLPGVTAEDAFDINNPPAKTIRFDGSEVVLGTNDLTQITLDEFWNQLTSLLEERKYFTASNFVTGHADVAEQTLWERWTDPDATQVRFIAKIASQGITNAASWSAMLDGTKTDPVAAKNYHLARSEFAKTLRANGSPRGEAVNRLRNAAQELKHPLAMVDAMHLMAVGEINAGRHAWAESLLLQAIELAERNQDDVRSAELWLMIAINSSRSPDCSTAAADAWKKAVISHSKAQSISKRSVNTAFWARSDRYRPGDTPWPEATRRALMVFARPVGCRFSDDSPVELVIWSAVGNARFEEGEPQIALLNYKKAETFATGEDVMWLRIAQSKCLATLGQTRAAAALLSESLAGNNPVISAAASAVLGSAKLQVGAFQQGIQLLNNALVDSSLEWPSRNKAEADLALAMLIIGDTNQGLKSLHAVQRRFEIQGNLMSLLQSLENELRLLEQEGQMVAVNNVRQRILQIESN